MMKVSVVIPTYNRLPRLKRVIAALEQQEYNLDEFEVVVVSDGSTDGTDEYLQAIDTPLILRPVLQHNQGVAVARNQGVLHARGEIILFIDDDVIPAPCLIAEHLHIHTAEEGQVVALGPMLTPSDHAMSPWVEWEQRMLEKQYHAMMTGKYEASNRQFFTGNTSLARQMLLDAGGFDPSFRRAEDVELAYRLSDRGVRFIFNPRAMGYHYAERSYRSWQDIPYQYGKNDVIFSFQKNHHWLLAALVREYGERHAYIRALTQACLDRPALTRAVVALSKAAGTASHRLGAKMLSRLALSAIFNLRYYQGVSDQMGGKDIFRAALRAGGRLVPQTAGETKE